jgi:hypothetical protein
MQIQYKIKNILLYIILFGLVSISLYGQDDKDRVRKVDSTYIFKPSKPVKLYNPSENIINQSLGLDVAFSNSGLGLGFFYNNFIDNNNILFGSFYISGARNTDEFEYWDYNTGQWIVPNKINRLFLVPITFGYSHILFANALAGSFKPFISLGAGPSLIFSNPYQKGWFEAWSYATTYVRFGGDIAIGADFRSFGSSVASFSIKYYYIPFGGKGLESIQGLPMTDFGGLVLSLSIGYGF